jgi:hypothetical protein
MGSNFVPGGKRASRFQDSLFDTDRCGYPRVFFADVAHEPGSQTEKEARI